MARSSVSFIWMTSRFVAALSPCNPFAASHFGRLLALVGAALQHHAGIGCNAQHAFAH
jgi:hypothetical protein